MALLFYESIGDSLTMLIQYFSEDVILMDYSNWHVKMSDKLLTYTGSSSFVKDKLGDRQLNLLVNAQVALVSKVSRNNLTRNTILCKGEGYLALLNKSDPHILSMYTNFLPF